MTTAPYVQSTRRAKTTHVVVRTGQQEGTHTLCGKTIAKTWIRRYTDAGLTLCKKCAAADYVV